MHYKLHYIFEALIDTLTAMVQNTNKEWNKDTADTRIDFEFLMNLVTQKLLAFTITVSLQKQGLDMVQAYDEVHVVIATLERTRAKADGFHHDCFEICSEVASKTK